MRIGDGLGEAIGCAIAVAAIIAIIVTATITLFFTKKDVIKTKQPLIPQVEIITIAGVSDTTYVYKLND